MTEPKLDLLKIASVLPTELGAGAAQVMRTEALDADCLCRLLNDRPRGPNPPDSRRSSCHLLHRPEEPSLFDLRIAHPGVDALLDPDRNRHGADASALVAEVSDHASVFSLLDTFDGESREFLPARSAAYQKRQDGIVALAF